MMYIADAMAPRPRTPVPTATSPADQTGTEYTIDELSAASSVPSRTIRFYQSKGALMPPIIRGRVAFYTAQHVERLKLIAQLQERGLRIDAIRGLVQRIERGELDVAEWLGVEKEMTTAWAHDQARTVTEAELFELCGSQRPGLIADLLRIKLAERRGDVYLVESPALLSIAIKLEGAGIDLDTTSAAAEILRKHMRRAVSDLSDLLLKRARDGALALSQQSKVLETLRPMGIEAVRILFAKQVEQGLRELLESGKLTSFRPRKSSRTRR